MRHSLSRTRERAGGGLRNNKKPFLRERLLHPRGWGAFKEMWLCKFPRSPTRGRARSSPALGETLR